MKTRLWIRYYWLMLWRWWLIRRGVPASELSEPMRPA